MNKRWIVALTVAGLLTGCTVGPKYTRPVVKAPGVYRGADPSTAANPNSLGDLKWFEVFKDDQLQSLIRTALVQNYDVRDAVAREMEARAGFGITRSDQFPQIGVTGGTTSTQISTEGSIILPKNPNGGFSITRTRNFGSILLNLASFEVDIWGRLRKATEAARANLLASEENRKAVVTTLVGDVASAYFDLLELDNELEIEKLTLTTRRKSLELIRTRNQGGVATMLDVRQAEELVYTAEVAIPNTELQIEQTENQITLLLGENPGTIIRGPRLIAQEQAPPIPPGLPSALLERRPDIRAAEQTLIAANANIGVAKAAYFPEISLTGFLGTQSSQLSKLFTGATRAWSFVPQVAQPVFTAGRLKSTVKLTEAQKQEAVIQYERAVQSGFTEVSDALIRQRRAKEIRVQQALLVEAVRDRVRLAYMRYEGGVDTLLNALDADRDLFNNELILAQDRRNELLALVQLYKALGGGWQQ
ncbi:MAG TPA: efflux transporter outer membrane subunit [Blastocatellia bacterium]|nr:efflux transporter outer membrane subunit [Blastocatellia bacterium]